MKGQTIIELKDVKTGKIERHVDNNMMTNAIAEIFKTRGLMARNAFTQTNLVKACLGGIVLFDKALTEDVSNVFPPADVNMVGNASIDVLSSDDVTEMGSYNSNESGWQNDGSFLAVYDFSTSQANGDIACVCLTSDVGAYVGFGNGSSEAKKSTTKYIFEYGGVLDTQYGMSAYYVARVDYNASTVDLIPTTYFDTASADYFGISKKIKIEKYKIPLSNLNLKVTPTSLKKVSEVEIDLPNDVTFGYYFDISIDDYGNIYIYSKQAGMWGTSQTYNLIKISNQNVASKVSLINTTGTEFNLNYNFYFIVSGNYLCMTHDLFINIYRFNLEDSSSIEIENVDSFGLNGNAIALNKGGYIYFESKILNVTEGWIRYHNGSMGTAARYANVSNHPLMVFKAQTGQITPLIHAMYLASINNLEQAVTKTADKTMKVSYRIMF